MPYPEGDYVPSEQTATVKKPNAFDDAGDSWKVNVRGDVGYTNEDRQAWFYTGKAPKFGVCPGVLEDGTITSLAMPDVVKATRQDILDYFDNTWTLTEVIFTALQGEEAYYRPPYHNLRHPMVFYYVHPAALYINKFRVAGLMTEPVNPYFERLFETGVDEMSWDDLSKNEMAWPSLRECTEYRRTVYQRVKELIETHPCLDEGATRGWHAPSWAFFMGFEHERIHLETSSVLMRELPVRLVQKPAEWPAYHAGLTALPAPSNELLEVPAGDVTIGKPADFPSYGWDNEYGSRTFHVRQFKASKYLITNAEFLEFVKAGGYRDKACWTDQGWKWRTFRNAKWPCFWVLDGPAGLHQYKLRLIFEVVDFAPAAPAIVNHHEAKAYCNWLSTRQGLTGDAAFRLLTEPEHHRLRDVPLRDAQGRQADDPVLKRDGKLFRSLHNLNLAFGAETPVHALPPTRTGFHDTMGNVWTWCEDYMASLPHSLGVHVFYDDFTTPCYDGEHNLILNGSFVATGDEASVFARYQFRPHFFQHAGFRIVSGTGPKQTSCMDSPPPHVGSWDPSTTKKQLTEQEESEALGRELLAHYAAGPDLASGSGVPGLTAMSGFPQKAAHYLVEAARRLEVPMTAALEVGCSVGGATFELAKAFAAVLAVDLNHSHIHAAQSLKKNGTMAAARKDEGDLGSYVQVGPDVCPDVRDRVTFRQMDPCCLAADLGPFAAAFVNTCLEKIPSPKSCLGRMGGEKAMVASGGLLMVASTADWSSDVLDKKLWLGGTEEAGLTSEAIKKYLVGSGDFTLVEEHALPILHRENAHKYTIVAANVQIFRKK